MRTTTTRLRSLAAIATATAIAAGSGCSNVPDPTVPPTRVYEVEAAYEFGAGSALEVVVPHSSADLTVIELSTDPQLLAERFDGDDRVLIVPDGTQHLRVTCRYRVFGGRDGDRPDPFAATPSPRDLFPGAIDVRFVGM